MNMKEHILAAMGEQLERWEELLAGLSEEQITTPRYDYGWSIQDVVAHLWAWQQVSVARMEAGALGRPPELPGWLALLPADWEEHPDQTNAAIYQAFHAMPWPELHKSWRDGYLRLLETGKQVPERDMLDGDRYPWLEGYSLAFVLVASYDHHQEHLEKVGQL